MIRDGDPTEWGRTLPNGSYLIHPPYGPTERRETPWPRGFMAARKPGFWIRALHRVGIHAYGRILVREHTRWRVCRVCGRILFMDWWNE